jgi:hypothetical protein
MAPKPVKRKGAADIAPAVVPCAVAAAAGDVDVKDASVATPAAAVKAEVLAPASAAKGKADGEIAPEPDAHARNKERGVVLNPGFIRRPFQRILVTGGAGFIGSHMCEYLLSQNDKDVIICVDNCFSGNKSNIEHLLSNKRFEFIRHGMRWTGSDRAGAQWGQGKGQRQDQGAPGLQ